ncbi:MAG: hypothetical protein QOD80_563 [Verrucomicrobiota bacterium]
MTISIHSTRPLAAGLIVFALTFGAVALYGQIGNNNPTGPAGSFNGNITTACSYDPFTGNAKREITDLAVTGGVGQYPLIFTRVANSRLPQAEDFGFAAAGGWRHSYAWTIDGSEENTDNSSFRPTVYPVTFPDGRVVYFTGSPTDTYFTGPPGVPERFQPINFSTMKAYLLLADGGKVEFLATRNPPVCDYELHPPCTFSYSYQAQAIIDPHGIRTTFSHNPDGSLSKVQEQAGRSIQLYYRSDRAIDYIQSSDGRIVQYHYSQAVFSPGTTSYTYLDGVTYPFEPALNISPTASYSYQAPNGSNPNGYPLLATCDDPMYGGPMKKISYTYATSNGDPGVVVAAGQILSENNATTGQVVSTLWVPYLTWRDEYRGDGPYRHLEYDGGLLRRFTDFKGQQSSKDYLNGYVSSVTDARHHTTTFQREGPIGALSILTHPDPEQSTQRFAYKYVDGAPYFLQIGGDERDVNSNTYFTRDDTTNRVTKIWYPDYPNGPTEEFTYNSFGQVETHTMTSGGVENFRYDGRGLMYQSWPPATPSDPNPQDHPTHYYYYTSGPQMDRRQQVVDPRGNSTTFEYNTRGLVTKVTHDQDHSYVQMGYNADGTLAWSADENHPNASWNVSERTRYVYDDYKRVTSVTNPMNETTNLSYAPPNGTGSYAHTTRSVYRATSQMGKITTFDYDENFRRKMVRKGAESSDDDGGTWFGYDETGNLASVQDPRGNLTTFLYDARNRRTSMTDPISTDRNGNGHTLDWEYDTRSNLTKETRADGMYRRMEYDPQSRVIDTYGFANEYTHYQRDLAGNVRQLTDPKPATYFFDYDPLNRKTSATYPPDATNVPRGETWHYDWAGNADGYTNPAGRFKHMFYDQRNRNYYSFWDGDVWSTPDHSVGQEVNIVYDNASRLTSVATNSGETSVIFGYDDANRQTSEEQRVGGYLTGRVETPRDSDGNRSSLSIPGRYGIQYDYTQRNQLRTIYDGNHTSWFNYIYDLNGNMTKRQDVYGGVNDSTNIIDGNGVSQYDALNRPTTFEQVGKNSAWFARSHFAYDNLSRLTASWRDEQASKGEWYAYESTGQLKQVKYNASQVWTGHPLSPSRTVSYTATADTLDWATMADSDNEFTSFYTPTALNQYGNVDGAELSYDNNFNLTGIWGFGAAYDAENRLTSATSGEDNAEFVYDGLGRCLKRTVDGDRVFIVYDGWKPILENDAWQGTSWNVYGPGPDEILYRHDATHGDLRYHLDRMGNVAFILDSDGDGIEKYTYDAFGRPTVTTWSGTSPRSYSWYGNRFMFTGREYFPELGIYDFRHRFYYPALGSFLQPDPLGFGGGDANLFRYCGGDPVNNADPSGSIIVTATFFNEGKDGSQGGLTSLGGTGWTTVTDVLGGLGALNQGGGGGGGGVATFVVRLPSLNRDSSGKGTVPSAPLSTQGYWTGPNGLPTGPNIFLLTDEWLERVLSGVYDEVSQFESEGHGEIAWWKFMLELDTEFWRNAEYKNSEFVYEGRYENLRGEWNGFQINYIGVGEGFAGHGISRSDMVNWIGDWNKSQYNLSPLSPVVIGKTDWSFLGWDYYTRRKGGGG